MVIILMQVKFMVMISETYRHVRGDQLRIVIHRHHGDNILAFSKHVVPFVCVYIHRSRLETIFAETYVFRSDTIKNQLAVAMCHAHSGQVILHETDSSAISKIIAEHSASASKYADFFRIAESKLPKSVVGDLVYAGSVDRYPYPVS